MHRYAKQPYFDDQNATRQLASLPDHRVCKMITKTMKRRWHDLKQRHREPRVSHTGRHPFVNDSIGKRSLAIHSNHHHIRSYTLANPILWNYPAGYVSAYTMISAGEIAVALLNGDIFRRLLHKPLPHTKHVVSSSALCVQVDHILYPSADSCKPSCA